MNNQNKIGNADHIFNCRWPDCNKSADRGTNYCNTHLAIKAVKITNTSRQSRFTAEQKQEMRLALQRFEKPKDIAKRFNTTVATVRRCGQ